MTNLQIPHHENPLVSIVIVTHGSWGWLHLALEALVEHTEPSYEVIVVDNASPDETPERLRSDVTGARVIQSQENIGFPSGVNKGAAEARGHYLCVLNSDTIVQSDWLPPLLQTMSNDDTIGATVPMFLNDDGTLQEAGSVIDAEGWAFALGAGDDPQRPEYRFRREVDFGSAACLMVKRETFASLGGFDPAYDPGYYEDVDLCFKLHELARHTVYEPRSRVVHVRFGSGSAAAATELVRCNRDIFLDRWRERLASRPRLIELYGRPGRILRARDLEADERFLVLCTEVPGKNEPTTQLVSEIARAWPKARVTLAALASAGAEDKVPPLLHAGVEVVAGQSDWGAWLAERQYHYSVVIAVEDAALDRLAVMLREAQPQAGVARLSLATDESPLPRAQILQTLADLGVAPPRTAHAIGLAPQCAGGVR